MNYGSGLHPHIRAASTARVRAWTAALSLLPAVCLQLFFFKSWILLFSSAAAAAVFGSFHLKNKNDFELPFLLAQFLLFFLMLPPAVPVPAAAAGMAAAWLLGKEVFGGGAASPWVPAFGGILFLKLAFQSSGLFAEADLPVWTAAAAAAGGLYLSAQGILRVSVPAIFLLSIFLLSRVFGISLNSGIWSILILAAFWGVSDSAAAPFGLRAQIFSAVLAAVLTTGFLCFSCDVRTAASLAVAAVSLSSPWMEKFSKPVGIPKAVKFE